MTQQTFRRSRLGIFLALFVTALALGLFFGWQPVKAIYFSGVPQELKSRYVCIPTGADFEDVVKILTQENFIDNENDFRWLAKQMNYIKNPMRAGRFEVQPGWNNRDLIRHLRTGEQAPVKVVFNNERLLEEVAGKAARFIEADSVQLLRTFYDKAFLAEIGYSAETLMSIFIPNTYEMYWNTDAKGLVRRMLKEHDAFWAKNNRLAAARALKLSPEQVYTLASIVERESNYQPERPTIASVYLNRLKINMKLQADPTCVFATRDFSTRRVLQYHTTFDSPYNTYMYTGLPPGPISMASISSIDAVLFPEQHNYLYFCAKPDDSGTHAFAATFEAHQVNAAKFQAYVVRRGY